jgi:hypothetical protein
MNKQYEIIKKAIENEIAIDNYLFNKLNYSSKRLSVFKMLRFKDKIPLWFSKFFFIFIPFYFIIRLSTLLIRRAGCLVFKKDKYFFSFSSSPKVIAIHDEYASDMDILKCVDNKVYCFSHYLRPLIIFRSFFYSIIFYFRMIFSIDVKYYLHLTAIFELSLFYEFVLVLNEKKINKVCVVNHYDRWLTVLTNIGFFEIEIIQHGILTDSYIVKNKIPNISSIRVFDESQLDIFMNNILETSPKTVSFIKINLNIDFYDKCDVLIISNPFFINHELLLYKFLKDKGLKVFFRPHPLYITEEVKNIVEYDELCLDKRFPCPNICLCNESTLGKEYEIMGFEVLWWNQNTDFHKIWNLVNNA